MRQNVVEGNTRTTALFSIKYLKSLGFSVSNNEFRENSWYFRNALVRANYADYRKNVKRDWSYLEKFFRNLILGEHHELKSRYLLIGYKADDRVNDRVNQSAEQVYQLILKKPGMRANELAMLVGKSIATTNRYIAELKALKRIEFRGAPKTDGYYAI